MKNKYFLLSLLSISVAANAQTFSDDFETYNVGDYIGANNATWTTWSGTTGTAEDAAVTDNNASNGTKSIYFATTAAGGGPQDVVLPFGGAYNSGQFNYKNKFFVESGKGAYFNFQGSTTIGQVYSMNCFMVQNGELILDNGDGLLLSTTYPINTWFELELDINLNTNEWELLIDGVSQGVFQNTENRVASLDLYPVNASYGGNNSAGYYVDEVSYDYVPYILPTRNGAAISLLNTNRLAGQTVSPTVTIRNLGVQNITSCDVTLTYNGNSVTENLTGLNLSSYSTYDVEFSQNILLIPGSNNMVATISNVNGMGTDDDVSDDNKILVLDPVVPAAGKMVVAEEGTGTWCGWCPRGTVAMDNMAHNYEGFFAGIAVHNGDPMTVPAYDDDLGISSFPGSVTDRGLVGDPSGIEAQFLQRITIAPSAFLTNGALYDSVNNRLHVSVKVDFQTNISGDYRIACAITEDSVTGTTSGYNQTNYYAGGGSGEMGGYESLPNPVPASQMQYDHVARNILPSFAGLANSFPASVNSGDIHYLPFEFNIDPSWNLEKLHIVSLLVDPSGRIDNAGMSSIVDGEENGYYYLGVEDVDPISKAVVYPNPASNTAFIDVLVENNEPVFIQIYDLAGKLIAENNYGELAGLVQLPIDLTGIASGVYNIKLQIGSSVNNQKLTVK